MLKGNVKLGDVIRHPDGYGFIVNQDMSWIHIKTLDNDLWVQCRNATAMNSEEIVRSLNDSQLRIKGYELDLKGSTKTIKDLREQVCNRMAMQERTAGEISDLKKELEGARQEITILLSDAELKEQEALDIEDEVIRAQEELADLRADYNNVSTQFCGLLREGTYVTNDPKVSELTMELEVAKTFATRQARLISLIERSIRTEKKELDDIRGNSAIL